MLKRLLCANLPQNIPTKQLTLLSETEAHHAVRVLRLKDGDLVEALDGKGAKAIARLKTKGGSPQLEWVEDVTNETLTQRDLQSHKSSLILELSILKGSAMEWAIEKSVELGVNQFIPVMTDHTVVQLKSKGPEMFQQRWQKIADQALKQCNRLKQMEVAQPITLRSLLTQKVPRQGVRLWCDESSYLEVPYLLKYLLSMPTLPPDNPSEVRILIGPEGGWSQNEREMLNREALHRIHLGPLTLRAETAALFAVSLTSAVLLQK